MGAVAIIAMILLLIAVVAIGVLTYMRTNGNIIMASQQKFFPFRAAFDPQTGQLAGTGFSTVSGEPQITCPAGSSINIVGAFYDVFDPYGETTQGACPGPTCGVNTALLSVCNPNVSNGVSCTTDSDCNGGLDPSMQDAYVCGAGNKCYLNTNATHCPLAINGGTPKFGMCIDPAVCGYDISGFSVTDIPLPNPTYNNAANRCAARDISALVAAQCDGLMTCPNLSTSGLGDYPCPGIGAPPTNGVINGFNPETGQPNWIGNTRTDTGYNGLPYIPGYPGGPPGTPNNNTSGLSSVPQNANLGYVIHGVYTCVPN